MLLREGRINQPGLGILNRDQIGSRLGAPALLLFAIIAFGVGLAAFPVTDRDEALFAQASKQMFQSGDWIDIRFQEGFRYKKPVGIYWAQASFASVFGTAEIWVYRLPSYLGAVVACLALFWAGRPIVGRHAALLAGFMLSCLFLLHVEARLATTDSVLLAASVVALGGLVRAWLDQELGPVSLFAFWTALAIGILVKGPLILGPVTGAIVWVGLMTKRFGWLGRLRPQFGIAWMLLLSAPWYIAISIQSQGAFIDQALFGDLLSKVEAAQESHGAPPGSYLLAFFLTFWPWTVLAPLAVWIAWHKRKEPSVLLLTGWIIPFWLILELTPTKLPHYPLMLYPAILLLAVLGVNQLGKMAKLSGAVFWSVGFALISGLVIYAPVQFGNGLHPLTILGVSVSGVVGLAAFVALFKHRNLQGLAFFGVSAVILFATLVTLTLPAMKQVWISDRLHTAMKQHACLDGPLFVSGYTEPSAVFLLGQETSFVSRSDALSTLSQDRNAIAWLNEAPSGAEGITRVSGFNYNTGKQVSLRLYVWPGIPATSPVCPRNTND